MIRDAENPSAIAVEVCDVNAVFRAKGAIAARIRTRTDGPNRGFMLASATTP
jgi:hypothetical protein